jgi:hypothetical protein
VDFLRFLNENALSSRGLKIFSEDASAFCDNGSGFVVFENLLLELFSFFCSGCIQLSDVGIVLSDLSFFLLFNTG